MNNFEEQNYKILELVKSNPDWKSLISESRNQTLDEVKKIIDNHKEHMRAYFSMAENIEAWEEFLRSYNESEEEIKNLKSNSQEASPPIGRLNPDSYSKDKVGAE